MKYLFALTALLFIGCADAPESTTNTIDMVLNKSYSVHSGDRIDNASTDSQVKVIKNIEGETTKGTLIAGSAQLLRAN